MTLDGADDTGTSRATTEVALEPLIFNVLRDMCLIHSATAALNCLDSLNSIILTFSQNGSF